MPAGMFPAITARATNARYDREENSGLNSGLALFVGFNHVQTFHDQADRGDEFPQSSGFLAQEGTPLIRNAI